MSKKSVATQKSDESALSSDLGESFGAVISKLQDVLSDPKGAPLSSAGADLSPPDDDDDPEFDEPQRSENAPLANSSNKANSTVFAEHTRNSVDSTIHNNNSNVENDENFYWKDRDKNEYPSIDYVFNYIKHSYKKTELKRSDIKHDSTLNVILSQYISMQIGKYDDLEQRRRSYYELIREIFPGDYKIFIEEKDKPSGKKKKKGRDAYRNKRT